ncbi:MAG: hypothetical protein J7K75_08610 [Desulfuromonas sp.]|nr:hypothetical protein [Desulfuromonas sp.]
MNAADRAEVKNIIAETLGFSRPQVDFHNGDGLSAREVVLHDCDGKRSAMVIEVFEDSAGCYIQSSSLERIPVKVGAARSDEEARRRV